jgi:hypothetical protein
MMRCAGRSTFFCSEFGFVCFATLSPSSGIFSPAAPPNQRNGPSDRVSGSKKIQRIQAEGRSSNLTLAVPRSIYENARDVARDIAKTKAYVTSRRERKKIEMLFAHLKRILRLDRLRLRGPSGAQDEFLLAATVQNLRKLAKLIPLPAPLPA